VRRCLIIDHDPDVREALKLMLQELGFENVAAPASERIFESMRATGDDPELFIFDLPFNQDDSWLLLDIAQTDPVLRYIPTICLSTSEQELAHACRRYDFPGGVRLLTKPFDLGELESAIWTLTSNSPRPDKDVELTGN
jgi:CheY-like chemotaxis protein